MNNTLHLSFLFYVPLEFFSPAVRIVTQYNINVRYTLDWKGEVTLNDYNVKPGMAQHIVKWDELEEQMLEAAKNNALDYRKPGDWMSNKVPADIDVDQLHPVFQMAFEPFRK